MRKVLMLSELNVIGNYVTVNVSVEYYLINICDCALHNMRKEGKKFASNRILDNNFRAKQLSCKTTITITITATTITELYTDLKLQKPKYSLLLCQ